jgi:UDP-N-acetylmuramoyl-L-alanyl-D-glutamate--2,6-diaminopimelate ligase
LFNGSDYDISSPLIGIPNVYNILSAAGVSRALDVPWEAIINGIAKTEPVKGRFERVDVGQDFFCFVDYAHTEDALARLIQTAREILEKIKYQTAPPSPPSPPFEAKGGGPTSGSDIRPRIITAFGCGGDRDKGKRPLMGEVATRLSDVVIITSDNPRSEEPMDIIRDIEQGTVKKNYCIEPDRGAAIMKAVHMANRGDIVLIAGKGHEDYQEIKGIRYEFSDRDFLEKKIKERLELRTGKCSM